MTMLIDLFRPSNPLISTIGHQRLAERAKNGKRGPKIERKPDLRSSKQPISLDQYGFRRYDPDPQASPQADPLVAAVARRLSSS